MATLACVLALFAQDSAHAQTTPNSVQGTWVHYFSGGHGRMTLQLNSDGTYRCIINDMYGKTFTDSGNYTVVSGTVLSKSADGSQSRLYFFWMTPNLTTIRVHPEGAPHAVVDATFSRARS